MTYQLNKPPPTALTSKYTHSGRGGAGNTFKTPSTTHSSSARGPASLFSHGLPAPSQSSKFSSGRGGAGNIHAGTERAIFSFDEELERESPRERKINEGGMWHVGRGGAGNWTAGKAGGERKESMSSVDSEECEK
jgi:hypothetical protein